MITLKDAFSLNQCSVNYFQSMGPLRIQREKRKKPKGSLVSYWNINTGWYPEIHQPLQSYIPTCLQHFCFDPFYPSYLSCLPPTLLSGSSKQNVYSLTNA